MNQTLCQPLPQATLVCLVFFFVCSLYKFCNLSAVGNFVWKMLNWTFYETRERLNSISGNCVPCILLQKSIWLAIVCIYILMQHIILYICYLYCYLLLPLKEPKLTSLFGFHEVSSPLIFFSFSLSIVVNCSNVMHNDN